MSQIITIECDCGFSWRVPAALREDQTLIANAPLADTLLWMFNNAIHLSCP